MSKSKNIFLPTTGPRRPTTGPRECRECGADAYTWHASWCDKVK